MKSIEYLKAFAEGPCNPTIFIPGILASKQKAVIDCPILRKSNPDLFAACGWKTCDGGRGTPNAEYTIWIPAPFTPMSIVKPDMKNRQCFSGLLHLKSEFDEKGGFKFLETPGVTIAPFGETEGTRFNSNCGFQAICNLVDFDLGFKL